MNSKLTENLKKWNVTYDSCGFLQSEDWIYNLEDSEDLLQIEHLSNNYLIDIGFYRKFYKIYVIYNFDWEHPKEEFNSTNIKLIEEKLYQFINFYTDF